MGTYANHDWAKLWHAKVENKCKFLGWLLLQNEVWTADFIIKHGGQANNICQLCRTRPESALHIVTQCSFSTQVWAHLAPWIGISWQQPPHNAYRRLQEWWTSMINTGTNDRKQRLICTVWNIWKECWRRVYSNKAMTGSQLQSVITSDVELYHTAWRRLLRFQSR
jgi:hypothetical protein